MRCSNCGGENESGVNFCQYCGAKLEQESNFSQNDFDKGQAGQTGYDPNYSNQAEYSNPLTCYDVNKAILKFKFKYIFLFKNFSKIVNNSNFRSFLMISSLRLPRYM